MRQVLVITTLFFAHISIAQNGYLGVSIGTGIPVGEYSKSNVYQTSSGYAKPGLTYNIIYASNLGPQFGFLLQYSYGVNALKTGDMASFYRRYGLQTSVIVPDKHTLRSMLGGLFLSSKGKDVDFDARFMFGSSFTSLPAITTVFSDGFSTLTIESTSAKSISVAFQFGVIFKIHAGEVIDVLISLDYFSTTSKYNNRYLIDGIDQGPNQLELPMRTITPSLGLAYKFN